VKQIAVLMGGWSAERTVSLSSGREVANALRDLGHEVREIDVAKDVHDLAVALEEPRPEIVFNALHGRGGEDGHVQAILDMLAIPYTHSGMLASALAMDKQAAKTLFRAAGLPVVEGRLASKDEIMAGRVLPTPYVVKPRNEGSSVGVMIIREGDNRPIDPASLYEEMLVERFVPGRELTVAVLGDRALPVIEIMARAGWYDFDSKYAEGGSVHICPAAVPDSVTEQAMQIALTAHRSLGCRGVSRADFRYDDTATVPGDLYLLEVNTQPGMTPTSLVPDAARAVGMSYADLVTWMLEAAACDA
jgi:D-alanine-D-alanine ligase